MTNNTTYSKTRSLARALCAIVPLGLLLTACGGSDSGGASNIGPLADTAVITTVASDFGSGQIELIDLDAQTLTADPISSTAGISDIVADTYADDFYKIERGNDRIIKFDLDAPSQAVWSYSALDQNDQGDANPYTLVFVSDTKAYLLRYNQDTAWIVNPSAQMESGFKTGELDLSAYTPAGVDAPGMSAGIIVDGKLFIALQRLDSNYNPTNTSCVAVYDISNEKFVDASPGQTGACGKGIALNGRNPGAIIYQRGIGLLVPNNGDLFPADPTYSGIDVIDPETYTVETRLEATAETGLITNIAVLDQDTAFFLGYANFGSLSLQQFNPTTGNIEPGAFRGVAGKDLRDIAIGPKGDLWVANAETSMPRIMIRNPETGMVIHQVEITSGLLPTGIDFAVSNPDDAKRQPK